MHSYLARTITKCFAAKIILLNPEVDLEEAIRRTMLVDQATKGMLSGKITPEELLEWVEPHIGNVDDYIDDVEHSLSLILVE